MYVSKIGHKESIIQLANATILFTKTFFKKKKKEAKLSKFSATYSRSSSRPLVETLLEELNDEMEPIRGQALLTVAKLVRKRNPEVLKCLDDEWLYGRVKGLYSKNCQDSMKIILEHRSSQEYR